MWTSRIKSQHPRQHSTTNRSVKITLYNYTDHINRHRKCQNNSTELQHYSISNTQTLQHRHQTTVQQNKQWIGQQCKVKKKKQQQQPCNAVPYHNIYGITTDAITQQATILSQ